MSFPDAVRTALSKYATFSGRARRSEYWWFTLFTVIVYVATSIIDAVIGKEVVTLLASLAFLLPALAVTVRRLHDTSRSGWWILIGIVPLVGAIVLLVFEVQDSHPGTNAYGPSPKCNEESAPLDNEWQPTQQ